MVEKRIVELTKEIGEKIDRFKEAGIITEREGRLLHALRDRLYGEGLKDKDSSKLEAMHELLSMAEKEGGDLKSRYSMALSLLRMIDPSLRPAGDSFIYAHTRFPMALPGEIYKPGTEHPLIEAALVRVQHEKLGSFLRLFSRWLPDQDEEAAHREAVRILAELSTRHPILIKGDKIGGVIPLGIVVSGPGEDVFLLTGGDEKRRVSPYPSDNPGQIVFHSSGSIVDFLDLNPFLADEHAKEAVHRTMAWYGVFQTYLHLGRFKKRAERKGIDPKAVDLVKEEYLRSLARLVVSNIHSLINDKGPGIEELKGIFLGTLWAGIGRIHIPDMEKNKRRRRELLKRFNRFMKELERYVDEELRR